MRIQVQSSPGSANTSMPRIAARAAGFTLLEVVFAAAILGMVIAVCLEFMSTSSDFYVLDTTQTHLEWRLQYVLDDLVADLKETDPAKVQVYDFTDGPGGVYQTAIVFPTARDQDRQFHYTDATGAVQPKPVWQGIVVYAFYSSTPNEPGCLCKYVDFSTTRNYEAGVSVSSITTDTITLSDGTTFSRALEGIVGNQLGQRLMGDFAQLVRDPPPPGGVVLPLAVKLVAQKQIHELEGDYLQAETSTGVMARNKN